MRIVLFGANEIIEAIFGITSEKVKLWHRRLLLNGQVQVFEGFDILAFSEMVDRGLSETTVRLTKGEGLQ